ncbi:MAG: hypothetical protein ACFB10_00520 [Salibacteraceae bacterium]
MNLPRISIRLLTLVTAFALCLFPFDATVLAQSNLQFGLSAGFGSTRQSINEVVATSGDNFGNRFSSTLPLGIYASMIPYKGLGWSSGFELTYQEMRAGYGDRINNNPDGGVLLTPRNAVESITRYSIPLMLHYRKPVSQLAPISAQIGAGFALDFYDSYSGYSATGQSIDSGTVQLDEAVYNNYIIPHTVSGSFRVEANLGYDFTRGGRLELGALFSFGLRNIYEGDFYYFENVEAPADPQGLLIDFEELVNREQPVDHYSYTSRGSYGVLYMRYWLPHLIFPFTKKGRKTE